MRRTIILALTAASLATPASAPAYSGDPWIDQYVEQVPTAGGPKVPGKRTGSGLSQAQIDALAEAGGSRFAYVTASSVPVTAKIAAGDGKGVASGPSGSKAGAQTTPPKQPLAALASTIAGGNGGLGIVFPAVILGTVLGGLGLAAVRLRNRGL